MKRTGEKRGVRGYIDVGTVRQMLSLFLPSQCPQGAFKATHLQSSGWKDWEEKHRLLRQSSQNVPFFVLAIRAYLVTLVTFATPFFMLVLCVN